MTDAYAVVVTTINHPTAAMLEIQASVGKLSADFVVIGDSKSPPDFSLEGSIYLDIAAQHATDFKFARLAPTKHYARKNVGYLVAIKNGASVIIETDDDNFPVDGFWSPRTLRKSASSVRTAGWCNVYSLYTDVLIWPRGLPLKHVRTPVTLSPPGAELHDYPIQQGLADRNPDVDAIYRLVLPLPIDFEKDVEVALDPGVWCPFNSQNTTWWKPAFPLLYLPFHCSFRMTDIWRSFVAQRIAWENGWRVLFHGATVYQERNEHDLDRDFADEVPGYLNNDKIKRVLEDLPLQSGAAAIPDNLRKCYAALIELGVVGAEELPLLEAWLSDLESLA